KLVWWKSQTSLLTIPDGTSNTLMIGEKHIRPTTQFGKSEDTSVYNGDNSIGAVGREAGQQYNSAGQPTAGSQRPLQDRTSVATNSDRCFGGPHPGVCQFVFCDGSVRPVKISVDIETLARLAAKDDGLPITGDF